MSDDEGSLADAVDDLAMLLMLASGFGDLGPDHRVDADFVFGPCADSGLHAGIGVGAVCGSVRYAGQPTRRAPMRPPSSRAGAEDVFAVTGRLIALSNSDVVWWAQDSGRGPLLRIAPLSVGDALAESLYPEQPVVLTSATLKAGGSFTPTLTALGLAPDTTCLDVGSGFDYAQQGILYVAGQVPPPNREGASMEALDELADLIEAAGGRTLALFSSWNGVDRAADYLRVRLGSRLDSGDLGPLLVQRRGESVAPVVQRFTSEPQTVLVGTVALWQGLDVPGNSLVLVTIDRFVSSAR